MSPNLVACQITDYKIVTFDDPFAGRGRSAEDAVFIQSDADITVVCRHPSFFIDQPANANDVFAIFLLGFAHLNHRF